MKRLIGMSFLAGILVAVSAYASPGVQLNDIQLDFTYLDENFKCTSFLEPVPALTLITETFDGKVVRASLRKETYGGATQSRPLEQSEYQNLRFFAWGGKRWIRRLPLSEKTVHWLLFHAASAPDGCRPPEALSTMKSVPHAFEFGNPGASSQLYLNSPWVTFTGLTESGSDYRVTMRVLQSQARYGVSRTPFTEQEAMTWEWE